MAVDLGPANGASISTITVTAGSGARTFGPIDLAGYASWSGTFTAVGSANGNVVLAMSHDNVTWVSVMMEVLASGASQNVQNSGNMFNYTNVGYTFVAPVTHRYLRLSTNSTVTGTYTFQVMGVNYPIRLFGTQTVGGSFGVSSDQTSFGTTLPVGAALMVFNGNTFDRLRTPNVFKSGQTNLSGSTTIWTPTTNKRFRLMKYRVSLGGGATQSSAGDVFWQFYDGVTGIGISEAVFVPTAIPSGQGVGSYSTGMVDLGNGYLSSAANNVLALNLGNALTSGIFRITAIGTEE